MRNGETNPDGDGGNVFASLKEPDANHLRDLNLSMQTSGTILTDYMLSNNGGLMPSQGGN